jgi:hypothetical protein
MSIVCPTLYEVRYIREFDHVIVYIANERHHIRIENKTSQILD